MKISTENLATFSFVCVFLFSLSFYVVPEFALWIMRIVLLVQAFLYASAFLDRFRT
jgi:hypothetical protein